MKVKEIGNVLLLTLFVSSLFANEMVELKVLDHNGKKSKKIALGMPFFIDVVLHSEDHSSYPKLETDISIQTKLEGASTSVYSVNGRRTASKNFRYSARANQEGVFTIGPAVLVLNGVAEKSKVEEIVVAEQVASDRSEHQIETRLELLTDRKTVYQGEEFTVSIRLCMTDDAVHIDGIQEPIFACCTASALEGPISGEETVKNITYKYLEWKTKVYAHDAGTLVIPSIAANITVETHRIPDARNAFDFFGMVGTILGNRIESKQLISNALKIHVINLPESDVKVSALGVFSSLTSKNNIDSALQGEGIVFTLELVGKGNFAMIQHPVLTLPDGLQYYDSNTNVHALGAGISKKDFEYIIQGTKPGNYTIPAQELVYFDKEKHTYKKLISKPIKIIILPSEKIDSLLEKEQEYSMEQQHTAVAELDVLEEDYWNDSARNGISFYLFLSLIATFFAFLLSIFFYIWFLGYRAAHAPYVSYKKAFVEAYKQLEKLKKQKNTQGIKDLFITLFAIRLSLPKNVITQERIEQVLVKGGYDESAIQSWKEFFISLMATEYGQSNTAASDQNIFKNAFEWLQKLEGKL